MRQSLEFVDIASQRLCRGQRHSIVVGVEGTLTSPTLLPVTVLAGGVAGPTAVITAGCHPGEYTGVLAAIELGRRVDPRALRGDVVIVPVQNLYGLQARRSYVSVIDNVDMGTAFSPRSLAGRPPAVSHHLAAEIFRSFISGSDVLIDLHGGEFFEAHSLSAGYYVCGEDAVDQLTRAIALATGLATLWEVGPGSIPTLPAYPGRGSARMEAALLGVPAIAVSAGGQGRLDRPEVDSCVEAILGVLMHLEMIEDEARTRATPEILVGGHVIFAQRSGLLLSDASPGMRYRANDVIGRTINLHGHQIESHRAPQPGTLLNTTTRGVVSAGDMLYLLGNVAEGTAVL